MACHQRQYSQLPKTTTSTTRYRDRPHFRRLQLHADRRLAYAHFSEEGQHDDGEYDPPVPHYNTQRYRQWKKECMGLCLTPSVVCPCLRITCMELLHNYDLVSCQYRVIESYILQAIQMALLPAKVYYKLQRVFTMHA